MKRRGHTPKQIVRKPSETDRLLDPEVTSVEVCQHLEFAEVICCTCRINCGSMKADDKTWLRELLAGNPQQMGHVGHLASAMHVVKKLREREHLSLARHRSGVNHLMITLNVSQSPRLRPLRRSHEPPRFEQEATSG